MANKGKSRSRKARTDILKNNARQAARKARQQQQRPKPGKSSYDKTVYDGTTTTEEES